jgi:LmeA-like phospholipid-binding
VARRRGWKIGIGLLVLLLVLVGGLLIVDRVAAGAAEKQIAQQARQQLVANKVSTPSDPNVSISGFPFLTQVLAGKYEKITIKIAQPKINNVQLNELDVVATTVRADAQSVLNGTGDVVADKITGTATISWANVRPLLQLAGLPKGIDPSKAQLSIVNNVVHLRVPFTIGGQKLALTAKGTLIVNLGEVQIRLDEVGTDAGSAPQFVQNLIRQYQKQLTARLKIPVLPFKLIITKVESSASGLLMIATGDNVKLSGA